MRNRGVELITYRGEIVATAGAREIYATPRILALDDADPLVMFVSLMGARWVERTPAPVPRRESGCLA
jgi:hypothetical protein